MEPTDSAVARACQETLDLPREGLFFAAVGAAALIVSQIPLALAVLVGGVPAWPWLLGGHLALGACVLAFLLLDPPDEEPGWDPQGGGAARGTPTLADRFVEGGIALLVLLLGGLLPLLALGAGALAGLHHLAGRLLLDGQGAPVPLRVRLRDGVLACEGHLPAHVRLAAATGRGLRPGLLRRLAARADGILHAGPWGTALSVRGRILIARGTALSRT